MGISLVRYTENATDNPSWGVLEDSKVHKLAINSDHHRDIMNLFYLNRGKFDAAISETGIDASTVEFLSPLSQQIQLMVQGINYASHRKEGGFRHEDENELAKDENLIFYKSSSTISKPNVTILRPKGVKLLDYEIELGLVIRKDITETTTITESNLGEYIGGLILSNDVSARDAMFGAPAMQWFKGKSHRTFCPVGPVLYLLEGDDIQKIYSMELKLKLNGKLMQDASTDQLIHKPPATLTEISSLSNLYVGDCILTGTPGGVLMNFSLKTAMAILFNFRNDKKRRKKLTAAQLGMTEFLKPGDKLELEIQSSCGSINLGQQRNIIAEA
jgi:2-keto-4-pentenoate hydratase/2-oxohepta-3-ene-1,7-dioic acid hydratase in catechol pathway